MTEPGGLVLVTGANGFVGSHLVEALLERGYQVRCMVRRTSDLAFVRHLPVEWAYADLYDGEGLRAAVQGAQAVCHCGALTRALDEETFMRINAQGAEALARACLEANPGLRRFLFVSSQAAAGPSDGPGDVVDESRPPRPVTWYGKSKLAAEQALWAAAGAGDGRLPLAIVRPAAVYGPRDKDFHAYFRLIKLRLNLQLGQGECCVSLIHVRDLVELLVRALEREEAVGQTYFGCGPASTYAGLAETIARALGRRPVRITVPLTALGLMAAVSRAQGRLTGRPALLNDQRLIDVRQRSWLCSGDKARRELGFTAQYDLETGVRDTAEWYRREGWL
ncbi:MAG: NAD-dependent epimerase/dehydratase family protein [Anaerolineae bacterium]|nr:NAD-dependent epimerase/dehydratase family protein [Anaerolineae bacterium]